MVMKAREIVTTEEIHQVVELRNQGYTRMQIADAMQTTFARVKYIISLLPKDKTITTMHWYSSERKTFTDTMPNPFPKWWREKHGLDHNFYRPKWKGDK